MVCVFPFVLVITFYLSGMGGPASSIRYRQHSSQDHVTAQVPPLRQSRDTFGLLGLYPPYLKHVLAVFPSDSHTFVICNKHVQWTLNCIK